MSVFFENDPGEHSAMLKQRACLLVLGMHRSGTSALTRVLNFLGASLPRNLMPPAPNNNATGFWEPQKLADLNEEILLNANSRWDDWHRLDLSSLPTGRLELFQDAVINRITLEYDSDASLIVLKEPRICRFAPFYAELLEKRGYAVYNVISLRNPLEVAASLERRDQMPSSYAAQLWLRHVLDAEYSTRGTSRAFICYEALLDDWRSAVGSLSDTFCMDWPRDVSDVKIEIDKFLSREHRHFEASLEDLDRHVGVSNAVRDAYNAILPLTRDPNDLSAAHKLDTIREEFERVSEASAFAKNRALSYQRAHLDEALADVAEAGREIHTLNERISDLKAANHRPSQLLGDAKWPIETGLSLAIPISGVREHVQTECTIAVIAHIFYEELAPEIRRYVENIPGSVNLFISTSSDQKKRKIEAAFNGWESGTFEIRVTANRGRDIAPKLVAFRDVYDAHEIILFIHSKRSIEASFLSGWRTFLLDNLVGSVQISTTILQLFKDHPSLGIVAPQHFELIQEYLGWGHNFDIAQNLACRMSFGLSADSRTDFPSGSMFWARSAAMKPLLDLDLSYEDFPEEMAQKDGTIAHAIERLFFYVCERAGLDWIKVARPDMFINKADISWRNIDDVEDFIAAAGRKLTPQENESVNSAIKVRLGELTEKTRRMREELEQLHSTTTRA